MIRRQKCTVKHNQGLALSCLRMLHSLTKVMGDELGGSRSDCKPGETFNP